MITVNELTTINARYLAEHHLNYDDIKMVEDMVEAITKLHEDRQLPQVGDLVWGTYYNGKCEFTNGIITEAHPNGTFTVCYQPYIPFASIKNNGDLYLSCSGGPFGRHRLEEFMLSNANVMNTFCKFGHGGACKDGAVNFKAPVRRWKIDGGVTL